MTRVNQLSAEVQATEDEIREQLDAVEREDISSLRATAEAAGERLADVRFEARVTHVVACRDAANILDELLDAAQTADVEIEQMLDSERTKAADGLRAVGRGPETRVGYGVNAAAAEQQFNGEVDRCAPVAAQLTRKRNNDNLISEIRVTKAKHLANAAQEAVHELDQLVGAIVGVELCEVVQNRRSPIAV